MICVSERSCKCKASMYHEAFPSKLTCQCHTHQATPQYSTTISAGPPDDDWQLISAASGSSNPSGLHQRDSQLAQQGAQQSPTPRSASPAKRQQQAAPTSTNSIQDFPELATSSNEELAALLLDDSKYRSLVSSIMARSSAAQVSYLQCS